MVKIKRDIKGEGSSGSGTYAKSDIPDYGNVRQYNDGSTNKRAVMDPRSPNKESDNTPPEFTISPGHRAMGVTAEDAVKKTYFRD